MRDALARLAARAPARVYPVVGGGARLAVESLRLLDTVELVDSPRSADILLVAGVLPPALLKPAIRIHDQIAPPRATVLWRPPAIARDAGPPWRLFPTAVEVAGEEDLGAAIAKARGDFLSGRRSSEPPIQPDHPPARWRGIGPYGHGGKGMTGGRPYGRPLPQRGDARDGLTLDRLSIRMGPFFPPSPPGLALDIVLQGDVLQEVAIAPNPFAPGAAGPLGTRTPPKSVPAGDAPPTIREIELDRARSHLRWLAHALRIQGLAALGRRALGLAAMLQPGDPRPILRLRDLLERTRALGWATRGVATIGAETADPGWGPIARAAGIDADARADDPAYEALGFAPVVHREGDARARWRQRLAEAIQAVELAGRAGDRPPRLAVIEGPRGPYGPGAPEVPPPSAALPDLLTGLEWGDAVTAIVSLDLDLEEEASR
ncbi:MAG: hypothetical protein ACREMD_02445 [Gemmatimonadota bacterium]